MKRKILASLMVLGIIATGFYACKRDKLDDENDSELTAARDEGDMESATEQSLSDINSAMDASSLAKKGGIGPVLCGATVDTSQKASGIITINYDNTTVCNGKKRSGSITLSIPAGKKWKEVGTTLTATFNAVKLTRVSDGKSITINGSKTITNVNGGLIREETEGQTIIHKMRGTMSITFDDNTSRNWTLARLRTWTVSGGVYQVKVEGDTTIDGVANVVTAGTNRKGNAFKVVISKPVIANSSCEFYRPVQGVKEHIGLERAVTVTFGVDEGGNAVSSGCAYGYKVEWDTRRNLHKTIITQYR